MLTPKRGHMFIQNKRLQVGFGVCLAGMLALGSIATGALKAPSQIGCAVQMNYADENFFTKLPDDRVFQAFDLRSTSNPSLFRGTAEFEFPPIDLAKKYGYKVSLDLRFIQGQSRWLEGGDLVDITSTLKRASDGAVLAAYSDHSDRVYTPLMLSLVSENKTVQIITKVFNPEVLDAIKSSENPKVKQAYESLTLDKALQVAVKEKVVHPRQGWSADVICVVNK